MLRRLLQLLTIAETLRDSSLARRILGLALWLVMAIGLLRPGCEPEPVKPPPAPPPRRPFFKRRPFDRPRPPSLRKESEPRCDPSRCC